MLDAITLFLFNIVVYNIPLLYGTAGEIMIEKSGSLNLGVEGTMAIGAVAGYVAACRTDSLAIGVLAGFVAAGLCGLIFAFLTNLLHGFAGLFHTDQYFISRIDPDGIQILNGSLA